MKDGRTDPRPSLAKSQCLAMTVPRVALPFCLVGLPTFFTLVMVVVRALAADLVCIFSKQEGRRSGPTLISATGEVLTNVSSTVCVAVAVVVLCATGRRWVIR